MTSNNPKGGINLTQILGHDHLGTWKLTTGRQSLFLEKGADVCYATTIARFYPQLYFEFENRKSIDEGFIDGRGVF